MPEVDAQHGHVHGVRQVGGAEEGAVTTEDEHQLASLRGVRGVGDPLQRGEDPAALQRAAVLVDEDADGDAGGVEKLGGAFRGGEVLTAARVRDEQHLTVGHLRTLLHGSGDHGLQLFRGRGGGAAVLDQP